MPVYKHFFSLLYIQFASVPFALLNFSTHHRHIKMNMVFPYKIKEIKMYLYVL